MEPHFFESARDRALRRETIRLRELRILIESLPMEQRMDAFQYYMKRRLAESESGGATNHYILSTH